MFLTLYEHQNKRHVNFHHFSTSSKHINTTKHKNNKTSKQRAKLLVPLYNHHLTRKI